MVETNVRTDEKLQKHMVDSAQYTAESVMDGNETIRGISLDVGKQADEKRMTGEHDKGD